MEINRRAENQSMKSKDKRILPLIVVTVLAGILLLSGIVILLIVKPGVQKSSLSEYRQSISRHELTVPDYDFESMIEEFFYERGLTEDDVCIQMENLNPGIYYLDSEGIPVKYDLKKKTEIQMREFHCVGGEEVYYSYAVEAYRYGTDMICVGYNGWNGAGAGYDVIYLDTETDTPYYICFGKTVKVRLPYIMTYNYRLVREGSCTAENEYAYVYSYYSADSLHEITPEIFSGYIGTYPIVMELVADNDSEIVIGTYYYKSQGPENRFVIEGTVDGASMTLDCMLSFLDDAEVLETMTLYRYGDEIDGTWHGNYQDLGIHLTKPY